MQRANIPSNSRTVRNQVPKPVHCCSLEIPLESGGTREHLEQQKFATAIWKYQHCFSLFSCHLRDFIVQNLSHLSCLLGK